MTNNFNVCKELCNPTVCYRSMDIREARLATDEQVGMPLELRERIIDICQSCRLLAASVELEAILDIGPTATPDVA